ncbi:ribosome maturation factor RimM [Allosaccharopolyspora coralli]|uniref:Ribosome maturation factor RimM n=1 Tax=Allosaccharopolyspora coralli TaxID=2665642 RepID=A0A5Q3QJN3_9PSEU|nr:ribosome maturation factor RimM [Allosaccharopolyspora coralli]QGK71037.1 ribosome maturation factor RimM [Allosaccharopolyspora coralli]
MTNREASTLVVGRIVKSHGVRGELVVEVRTDSPEQRFVPGAVLGVQRRGHDRGRLVLAAVRPHAGRLLVFAEEVEGREAAEELRGALLTVSSDELEDLEDPEEFHDHQLVGLRVVLTSGSDVGEVEEVLHTPAGELLSVRDLAGAERLVPFVSEIVPEVDLAAGRVVVDPPEGLLEDL